MFGTPVLGQMLEKKASSLLFREKIKSSYPKVLMNNLAEDVDKHPPNEGLVFVGTSEPHTSRTALQDACVCWFVCDHIP